MAETRVAEEAIDPLGGLLGGGGVADAAAGHAMSVKASGGKGGLGANAAFASATGDRIKDATSVTFIDSASTIRDGSLSVSAR